MFEDIYTDYWNIYYTKKYFCQAREMLNNLKIKEIKDKTELYNIGSRRTSVIEKKPKGRLEIIYIVPDKETCKLSSELCIELNKINEESYCGVTQDFIKLWKYVIKDK